MVDIDDIVEKVRCERGWTKNEAELHRSDYLAFLGRAKTQPERPSVDVDAIWHAHILHTRRYRADCQAVAGGFVDHEPFSGEERDALRQPTAPNSVGPADSVTPAPDCSSFVAPGEMPQQRYAGPVAQFFAREPHVEMLADYMPSGPTVPHHVELAGCTDPADCSSVVDATPMHQPVPAEPADRHEGRSDGLDNCTRSTGPTGASPSRDFSPPLPPEPVPQCTNPGPKR